MGINRVAKRLVNANTGFEAATERFEANLESTGPFAVAGFIGRYALLKLASTRYALAEQTFSDKVASYEDTLTSFFPVDQAMEILENTLTSETINR